MYVVHLSTRLGLERIKRAQAEGQRVWTETCPQYLLLSDKEMERWGPFAKIGPPLRPADGPDRAALWAGSEAGYIATVASDHSPRVPAAKEPGRKNIFVDQEGRPIPFGAPSLETLVPLMYNEGVVNRGLPISWMARVMAENPARIFGLYPRKGVIRVGADADLTIWDPRPEWTIEKTPAPRHRGLHAVRGPAGARPPVDDAPARPGAPRHRRIARAEAGLRPVPRADEPAPAPRRRGALRRRRVTDYLDRLARFAEETRFDALPESTVAAAKLVLLDTLGAIVGGSALDENARLARFASGRSPPARPRCSAIR